MIRDASCYNVGRDTAVKLFWDNNTEYNTMMVGAGSYIVKATLEFGNGRQSHVLVGNYTSIAHQVLFLTGYNHDHHQTTTYPFDDFIKNNPTVNSYTEANRYQIIIGNDVWIGRGVTILGGVRIGNGAVIGASAVVAKDVPPYAVVVGNPARIVKYRFELDVIDKLQQIKWWYWDRVQVYERLPLIREPRKFVEQFYDAHFSIPPHPIVARLKQFKASGKKIYFLPADFGVPNAVYGHVFDRYIQTFTEADDTLLIIGYPNGQEPDRERLKLPPDPQTPQVGLMQCDQTALLNVLSMTDVLITTREFISLVCVDYATDYGAEIISGLDEKVFEHKKLREKITFADEPPLLTLGLPTFNRLKYLRKSLSAICEAVGNDRRVEILVNDNDSTDGTEEFVRAAQHHYSNLIYRKNAENLGANRNILKIYSTARGRYVMAVGDDDNLTVEAINRLLEMLESDTGSSVIMLRNVKRDEFEMSEGSGTVEYIRQASFWTTYISGLVLKKSALDEIAAPDRYSGTNLDQVYLQLTMLKNYPRFRILFGRIFRLGSGLHVPSAITEASRITKRRWKH